jgi:hypothetical protein
MVGHRVACNTRHAGASSAASHGTFSMQLRGI